ncbi:hypothetical protein CHS0354_003209 [Potamilus streckersoni]|uniref:Sushi domain-containing protein n=1 Tax=Potamilus streckersoni TaxID=2493646 RepID=A0AAE0VXF4_9BIVA|nr:hypothetical protein CHS0354_003209 [Potamilus streckersoni]
MLAHSISSRSRLLIIFIIISIHTQISPVFMIRQSQDVSPNVKVDLDICYSARYYTNFLGEINCSSDATVYNSQVDGLIQYSPEQGWQFQEKPFVCTCTCNFSTKELSNGYVVGNGVVSHKSYLNYTCHPGFKRTTSSRIICLDGIFVSVESDDNVERPDSVNETATIFRKYPLSNKDYSRVRKSVYKFVIDSGSWTCNNYPAQKGLVYKVYSSKIPYKLLRNQEETCYKDGHIDISRIQDIGCIKEKTNLLTPVDSVHQNNTYIYSVSIVGCFFVIYFAVGIVKLCRGKRKVSKALKKKSIRECDPHLSSSQQESAPTSSSEFCPVAVSVDSKNKCFTHLTDSEELCVTENKHLFYSKSGNCRIACLHTPKILRKTLSKDDFVWIIDSKYLEDDSVGDEYVPEDSERPQCSNMTENINSWSRHISKRSDSKTNVSVKHLYRSYSDCMIPFLKEDFASASTAMKENNTRVDSEDDDSKSDKEDVTLHREDNDERETNDMKHDGSSFSLQEMNLTEDGKRGLQNRNGCTLSLKNSKSDRTLGHSSSREMDPDSLRWKSDPNIFSPSLLKKAWRNIEKIFFRRKDFQSFVTRIEIDCI